MLLFNSLQTFLQMHNLIHVVILSDSIVLLSELLVIELDKLSIAALRETL